MSTVVQHPIKDFYGFSRMPFDKDFAAQNAFRSPCLADAVAMCALGVESEDILLLTGAIGSGKSVAVRSFMDALDQNRFTPVYLRGHSLGANDLPKLILQALLVEPPWNPAKARTTYFKTVAEAARKPIIVIDDAQDLKESALLSVKGLVNFDSDSKNKITFILCGQPELKDILRYTRFAALYQRIRLWCEFTGFSLPDTCAYIDHQLTVAGRPSPLFSDNAKAEIHRRSLGFPRRINRICIRSIFEAAARKLNIIDDGDVLYDSD